MVHHYPPNLLLALRGFMMPMTTLIDTAWHPLATGCPPEWASAWGQDRYGVWVEFEVPALTVSASPNRCVGSRRDGSGWDRRTMNRDDMPEMKPAFSSTRARGTVSPSPAASGCSTRPAPRRCGQAVMGRNPSRFQSPTRPVENVSWDDVQAFLEKINEQIPDLNLTLPTEAQWEHACRAGTDTATYAGPLPILGANNAPALDEIAWYGGNSGVDFELDNGWDSSSWPEKQYDHQRAGTHPVAQKTPNAWGLYDMLGNVWEWCHDGVRQYTAAT